MSAGVAGVHRFDECCVCLCKANEIDNGREFRAIGHLPVPRTVAEQAECVHAVCLPCIQREDEGLAGRRSVLLNTCASCRSPLIDGIPDPAENQRRANHRSGNRPEPQPAIMQRREFTVRPVVVVGGDGQPVTTPRLDARGQPIPGQHDPVFRGEVTLIAETLPERINNIRERSKIERALETIGRELVGRVVGFVVCAVAGAAFGMAQYGIMLAGRNAAHPEEGIFIPRAELNGMSQGFVVTLAVGAAYGICFGIIGAVKNPYGDEIGRAGALVGRAIVSRLEDLNSQIERANRAWANLFVNAAQQPIG